MKNYIEKPNYIKKEEFDKKSWSLSSKDYYILKHKNLNIYCLKDFIINEKVGREIGSENYTNIKKYRFLKTVNIGNNFCIDESNIEYCVPEHNIKPNLNNILIAKDGGGDGLGEVVLYNIDNKNDILSSGILCIQVQQEKLFYILAFLKSNFFKTFININTPEGSTIRHSKKIALDFLIPFPTQNKNKNPQDVEKLVSLITQNIIDKEEQIKLKNEKINNLIEEELYNNQKENKFKYSFPTINDISREGRLDTGIYGEEYKKIEFLIENYKEGFNKFDNLIPVFKSGETPKNYIIKEFGKFIWLSNKDFRNNYFNNFTTINTQNIKNIVNNNSLVISRRAPAGICCYIDNLQNVIVNDGLKIINFKQLKKFEVIFISIYINSNIFQQLLKSINGSIFGGLTNEEILKFKIPLFPESKQQKIAKE